MSGGDEHFREGYIAGIKAVASWASSWDTQIAEKVNGYRFSDMILCKFNLTRRKHARKVAGRASNSTPGKEK